MYTTSDAIAELFVRATFAVGKAFAVGLTAFLIVLGARCGWVKAGQVLELPAKITLEDIRK